MKTVSLYRKSDGLLTGQTITLDPWDEARFLRMLPDGHHFVEGQHDHRTRKVHLDSGDVVEHTPPPDPDEKRRAGVLAKAQEQARIDRLIAEVESRQHRAVRELVLHGPDDGRRARVVELDQRIADLRASRPV